MNLFFPLVKADEEKRQIYARATAEQVDKTNEILDYMSAKPQFAAWSKQYADATLGKSNGNLRAMHNPKHIAGKIEKIIYNDGDKSIDVVAKIVDPTDWKKVEEGCYTGLSIGGGYLKKWTCEKTGATRYTPRIQEISLVDSPCLPSARILEMQKADGTTEEVLLKGVPRTFAQMLPPPSFGDLLLKAWDPRRHPREHTGQFASKPGEKVGRYTGGGAGAFGGYMLGAKHGEKVGAKVGRTGGQIAGRVGDVVRRGKLGGIASQAAERAEMLGGMTGRALGMTHGRLIGATALGAGGYLAGAALGSALDRMRSRGRAKKAGKLEQWQRLNSKVSSQPQTRKQIKRAAKDAMVAGRKLRRAHEFVQGLSRGEPDDEIVLRKTSAWKQMIAGTAGGLGGESLGEHIIGEGKGTHIGGFIGGTAGEAIGSAVGGIPGALVGGAIGGAAGSVIGGGISHLSGGNSNAQRLAAAATAKPKKFRVPRGTAMKAEGSEDLEKLSFGPIDRIGEHVGAKVGRALASQMTSGAARRGHIRAAAHFASTEPIVTPRRLKDLPRQQQQMRSAIMSNASRAIDTEAAMHGARVGRHAARGLAGLAVAGGAVHVARRARKDGSNLYAGLAKALHREEQTP